MREFTPTRATRRCKTREKERREKEREREREKKKRRVYTYRRRKGWKKEKRDGKRGNAVKYTDERRSLKLLHHVRTLAYFTHGCTRGPLCQRQFIRYRARPRLFPPATFIIFTRMRETGKKRIPCVFDTKEIRCPAPSGLSLSLSFSLSSRAPGPHDLAYFDVLTLAVLRLNLFWPRISLSCFVSYGNHHLFALWWYNQASVPSNARGFGIVIVNLLYKLKGEEMWCFFPATQALHSINLLVPSS